MTNTIEYKEFINKLNNCEAAFVGKSLYYVADKENSTVKHLIEAEDMYNSIDILDLAYNNGVSFNSTQNTYTVGGLEYSVKLLQASSQLESNNNSDIYSLESLDYYPSVPEGKLFCISGVNVVKKKELAMKMRELAINCCPYLIIDSTNSRQFISHCTGQDVVTSLTNNERIAEVAEMVIKQGINVIVLTARSEIVYIMMKGKIENSNIVDISSVDLDNIKSEEDLSAIWRK